jgi:predicted flap endonuclease-1-like 5' DNA nuclease/archaellum component FlaC
MFSYNTLLDISVCNLTWWHWLLALLIPFLLGYLFRYFLNGKLRSEINSLQQDKTTLEADLKKAKSMKMSAAAPVVTVDKSEINSLKDKVRDLETHNGKLKKDIQEALAVKAQFAGINLDALHKRISELEGIESHLNTELQSARALNASLTANTGDLEGLRQRIADGDETIRRLNIELNTIKTQRDSIIRENDSINNLRNDVRELSGKVGALTLENERLRQNAGQQPGITADTAGLRAQLDAAVNNSTLLQQRITELEAEQQKLQAGIAGIQTEASALAQVKAEAATLKADAEALKAQLADTKIDASNARLRLEQAMAEMAMLKEAAATTPDTNGGTTALQESLARLEADNADLRKQLDAARSQIMGTPAPVVPDDLKIVEGIGPKIEELFNAAGIFTWKQLYNTPIERLREILVAAGPRFQVHDPATWPEQARLADEGKLDELKVLQDRLNAGRE